MKASLISDRSAVVALEFAVVAPAMLAIFMGAFALTWAMWTQNVLQTAAEQAARCAAIASTNCSTVTAGCDSAVPAVCFAEQTVSQQGVANVTAANITINTNAVVAGSSFTQVTITRGFDVLTYSLTLTGVGLFPNKATSWGQT